MSLLLPVLIALAFTAVSPLPQTPHAPAPEMQRFLKGLVGEYTLTETHHARPGNPEWSISGTASYRPGPDGMSVIEQYQSNNPKGPFTAVAVLWWDASLEAFKHFECETGEPCGVVDDVGRWDGNAVVFTREVERQGRKYRLEARYDLSHSPAVLTYTTVVIPAGADPITTMTISYRRK